MLDGLEKPCSPFIHLSLESELDDGCAANHWSMWVRGRVSMPRVPWSETSRFMIRSTASDPQVLHRPWESSAICSRQLMHSHCFFIGSFDCLRPKGWRNMFW